MNFAVAPFTVSFHWRSRQFVNSSGVLDVRGVIARIPVGDVSVDWGKEGLEISLIADKKYVLANV